MGAGLVVSVNTLPASTMPRRRGVLRRFVDLSVALHFLLHDAGNHEAGAARVTYTSAAADMPLAATFHYGDARGIVDEARTTPRLLDAAAEAEAAWHRLRRPHASTCARLNGTREQSP
jgi:hypothetical protein